MIRLIACDLDGTLLDSKKRFPSRFDDAFQKMEERNILFVAASGRQYASLARDFHSYLDRMAFLCENGSIVMYRGQQLFIDGLDDSCPREILDAIQFMDNVHPIVCYPDVAYVAARSESIFLENCVASYPSYQIVDDLYTIIYRPGCLAITLYDENVAQDHTLPYLSHSLSDLMAVFLSDVHWIDVMNHDTSKGKALARLQKELGILPEECMAFGDFLNDLSLLNAVGESYAMENGHPDLKKAARYLAPSNDNDGVMRILYEKIFT